MIEHLFNPESVAVIGASADPSKVGYAVLKNLISSGYAGKVFPVNPRGEPILGCRTYPAIAELKGMVDLAVICIPAGAVPGSLRECVSASVKAAVIISAGFKEAGREGMKAENEIREIISESGIRVLGPNCLGIMNTRNNLNATFAAGMLPGGRMAFFSQSGALGVAILDWAIGNQVGFSKFVSLGNKADLNETDFIEYLSRDSETDIIMGYIEDVADGKRFLEAVPRITRKKPVILIKSGGTQAGARAASSHTGAIAGSDEAFRAAFTQTGVIRAEGIHDLFETARVFSSRRFPEGKNLVIITNAGGPGIMAADMAEKLDLNLPILDPSSLKRMSVHLPGNASLGNPIDIIGDARSDRYRIVLREAVRSSAVDGIIVILTPQAMVDVENVALAVVDETANTRKPVITCIMGQKSVSNAIRLLEEKGIPNFSYPEDAVRSFKKLHDYAVWRAGKQEEPVRIQGKRAAASRILRGTLMAGRASLTEDEARGVLEAYGFIFPRLVHATTKNEAASLARGLGFPVAMKISSPDILHKTDVGGVRLGISSPSEALEAFSEITANVRRHLRSAMIEGVNIYEMIKGGKEVIIGVTYDRTFGHMVMFGLGGIYVEVMKDVSFRILPVNGSEARQMIRETRGFALLQGARGEKPANLDFITAGIARVSQLIADFPEIYELDINPLVILEDRAVALDARIILSRGTSSEAGRGGTI
ncbi:MAG: acetate--CoA ligase alpha subunit [bacterium]